MRKNKNKKSVGMPEYLRKWRKEERRKYINRMAANNELDVFFYVVKLFNDNERFIKIGISIDIEQRFKDNPYNFKILKKAIFDLNKAWLIETWCLDLLYSKKVNYKPKIYFKGSTECFNTCSLIVLQKIFSKNGIM